MDYQVFISFKNSDENGYTEDRQLADALYQYLTAKGIKTFYSNVSGNNGNSTDIHWWRTDDGDLIVKAVQAGNIIDCSRWQSRAFVPYLYAYLPRYDELICFADSQFYAYSRYTTEQQMRKAQEALGDFRLSEDQLKFYGLS